MPLPLQSLLLFLLFKPIVGTLKVCLHEHLELYGVDIASHYPVDNSTDCQERCINTPECLIFSFREVQKECYLMSEFLAHSKKNAWKVTSGYLIEENTDRESKNFTTCEDGGGLVSQIRHYMTNQDCWYESDFLKCGILTEDYPDRKTGCFVSSQRSIYDCQVRKFRMLRKPWQHDFYGNGKFEHSEEWQFMRDESCQIETELDGLCKRDKGALFVQTYSVMSARTVACRTSDSYESHPSHFFKAAFWPEPLPFNEADGSGPALRWPKHEVIRQPAFFGIYPQFVYFCKSLVLTRRSLQDRSNACGGMVQAKGSIFPPDAKQPWPKVDSFRHCQEICQMFMKCIFVSYEFEKRLCWMYSSVIQVYPNNAIISGPKKCTFSDSRKLYSVEDFLESWTGSASMENQGIKYEKLLEIYAKEEDVDYGIACQGFEPPRWCKMLGGFEVALFYSESMDCTYEQSAQNCSVVDTSKREYLCAFCNIRNDAGKINSLHIPTPDQCQLDCGVTGDKELTCQCDITALQ